MFPGSLSDFEKWAREQSLLELFDTGGEKTHMYDDMEGKQLLVFTCLVSSVFASSVYDVENIHVENEDGTTQTFEIKRLEPVNGEACASCSQYTANSSPRLAPIRSNVFIAVGEVATECGKYFIFKRMVNLYYAHERMYIIHLCFRIHVK